VAKCADNGAVEYDRRSVFEERKRGLCRKESCRQVDADDVFEGRFFRLASRSLPSDSGVGEDDIKIAEVFCELCEEVFAGGRVADVGTIGFGFWAEELDGLVEGLLVAACDGYFCAFFDEELSGGETDATVAAGDENFLSFEFHELLLFGLMPWIADCLGWWQSEFSRLCMMVIMLNSFKHDVYHE
jgi:hypothetical protein